MRGTVQAYRALSLLFSLNCYVAIYKSFNFLIPRFPCYNISDVTSLNEQSKNCDTCDDGAITCQDQHANTILKKTQFL